MEINGVTVPAKAKATVTAMLADNRFAAEEVQGVWLSGSTRNPALIVLTTDQVLVNAQGHLGTWDWAQAGPLTLADGKHPQINPTGSAPMTFLWSEDPKPFADLYRGLRAQALSLDEWTGPIGTERLLTIDHFPGHDIEAVLGTVTDNVSSMAWGSSEKDPATSFQAATESIRAQAERLGANAIIGLSAVALTPRTGLAALAGDTPGVLLMGTAVRVKPAD